MRAGPRNAITDVAGLRVGSASDDRLVSGATVLVGDRPFVAGVNVMGGAPGTRETDLLAPDKTVQEVDALVLSGGSAYGLDAASGVMDGLRAMGRGFHFGAGVVPIVPAAILFDLTNGGDKGWTTNPYAALGRAAFDAVGEEVLCGSHGAGMGATAMDLRGGLGTASCILRSGHTVGALVAVNPVGRVCDDEGRFLAAPWCLPEDGLGVPGHLPPDWEPSGKVGPREATTIAIVATDAQLTQAEATRLATAAQDGMARAIQPSHTPRDGDLVFAAATGDRALADPYDALRLGHAAASCLARAIARGVRAAAPVGSVPAWSERFG